MIRTALHGILLLYVHVCFHLVSAILTLISSYSVLKDKLLLWPVSTILTLFSLQLLYALPSIRTALRWFVFSCMLLLSCQFGGNYVLIPYLSKACISFLYSVKPHKNCLVLASVLIWIWWRTVAGYDMVCTFHLLVMAYISSWLSALFWNHV